MQNKEKQAQVEVIRQRAQKKANSFAELFGSPIGQEVLLEIKAQFDGLFLVTENPHETTVKASQRDVVHWIEELIDRGSKT